MNRVAMRFVLCVGLFVAGAAVMMGTDVGYHNRIPLAIATALWLASIVLGIEAIAGAIAFGKRPERLPEAKVVR